MPDLNAVSLSSPTEGRFHPLGLAPRTPQPRIIVEYDGQAASPMLFSLEIGLGEPVRNDASFRSPAPVASSCQPRCVVADFFPCVSAGCLGARR